MAEDKKSSEFLHQISPIAFFKCSLLGEFQTYTKVERIRNEPPYTFHWPRSQQTIASRVT